MAPDNLIMSMDPSLKKDVLARLHSKVLGFLRVTPRERGEQVGGEDEMKPGSLTSWAGHQSEGGTTC